MGLHELQGIREVMEESMWARGQRMTRWLGLSEMGISGHLRSNSRKYDSVKIVRSKVSPARQHSVNK